MPHAARQPRSWLIFDVGQKMAAVIVIVISIVLVLIRVLALSTNADALWSKDAPILWSLLVVGGLWSAAAFWQRESPSLKSRIVARGLYGLFFLMLGIYLWRGLTT